MTAYITFNGKKSSDFGLRIINDMHHESTHYDVEEIVVPGRDGVLLKDNKRLVPIEMTIPFTLSTGSKRLTEVQTDISNWLNIKGWFDLTLSWDTLYIYKASIVNSFSIDEVLRNFGELRVTFKLHPIKYIGHGKHEVIVTKGGYIENPGNVIAKPIIKINTNGSGWININGRITGFENIQGGLTIDMDKNVVYSGNLSAWDKILRGSGYHMPYLDVGRNMITWSGNYSVTMQPNWGVKI